MMTDTKQYHLSDYRLPEVRIRLAEGADTLYSTTPISSPQEAARIIGDNLLRDLDREMVVVVSTDTRMRAINYCIASIGTLDQSAAHPREILKSAVLSNAAGLLILHNHPSGDTTPSQADLEFTAKMSAAGRLLDIPLIDHVIIGGGKGEYYSLSEHGLLNGTGIEGAVRESAGIYKLARKERVAELTEQLKTGVTDYLSSARYRQLLRTLSKFHHYSLNNTILIAMQNPAATQVASYTMWQALHRQVNAGEKGIKILCPMPYKTRKTSNRQSSESKQPNPDTTESDSSEELNIRTGFRVGYVFDVSQTSPIPGMEEIEISPVHELTGDVGLYDDLIRAASEISPVPVRFEGIFGGAKGYFSPAAQEIAIKSDMSQAQTVKTLVHEICHSRIHNPADNQNNSKRINFTRQDAEIQAESVAFVVCSYVNERYNLNLDTSEYSFPYVATWAGTPEKILPSLSIIKDTAEEMVGQIDMVMAQIANDHIAEQQIHTQSESVKSHMKM